MRFRRQSPLYIRALIHHIRSVRQMVVLFPKIEQNIFARSELPNFIYKYNKYNVKYFNNFPLGAR